MRISQATYTANNVVYIQRQSSSGGVGNRITAGAVFGSASQGETSFTSSDTELAFKIERLGNVYRCYYSLTQSPDEVWVLLAQFEDDSSDMGRETTVYVDAYSPGNADEQTAVGDFDNFKLYNIASDVNDVLSDIKNKDGNYTFDKSTDSLEAISEAVSTIDTVVDTNQDLLDGTTATPTAYRREYGVTQIMEFSITAAANAGVTTVATITTQPCMIESIVIHADAAQTGDMTSCAIEGGASQVVEFIGAAEAIQANLDAADKQVSWAGAVRLAATKTITIDLQGTGATAVDLTITIKYRACVDGGYLT
jgi:hypothetical protein